MWGMIILAAISACAAGPLVMLHRPPLNNKRPGSGNIDTTLTRNVIECGRQCSGYGACRSVFYIRSTGECQTHSVVYTTASPGLFGTASAVYYEKEFPATSSQPTNSTGTPTPTPTTVTPCVSMPTPFACPPTSTTTFTPVNLTDCTEFSFRIFTDASRDFWQSKAKCEAEGGKLVAILTLAKMNYMRDLTTCNDYANLDYWTDGLYNNITATWETTGGTPLPMSQGDFWGIGKPNLPDPNGQCVWMGDTHNFYLDDEPCTAESWSSKPRTVCELV